jgi:hypothetical protein
MFHATSDNPHIESHIDDVASTKIFSPFLTLHALYRVRNPRTLNATGGLHIRYDASCRVSNSHSLLARRLDFAAFANANTVMAPGQEAA